MSLYRRLFFYLLGVFLGLGLVFIFFGKRKFSCNIIPNERVLTELKTKRIIWEPTLNNHRQKKLFSDSYLKDSVFSKGSINFEESEAQREPHPRYVLFFKNFKFKIEKKRDCLIILDIDHLR